MTSRLVHEQREACRRKSSPTEDLGEIQALRVENARLKALLSRHGIPWDEPRVDEAPPEPPVPRPSPTALGTSDKIALFRRLFQGRTDVFPLRWESSKGRSGYSPACGNEWKAGICRKPTIKCRDCTQRLLLPVTDQVIYDHLAGRHTAGVYPLLTDDTCRFLAVDFDKTDWRDDVRALAASCRELKVSAATEISRSGNGAHVWIFFSEPVPAREARQLGTALISHTCNRARQLALTSYDRLFPNQDTLPKGGFGNLIALPLQRAPRELGRSVFVDEHLVPYPDQWSFLASVISLSRSDLEDAIIRASNGHHPLDVAFASDEHEDKPWQRSAPLSSPIPGPLPESLTLVLANQIFIAKAELPQPLANRLIRMAAFQNPEFYKAQAMRMPVWDKPRVIGCAENFGKYVGLPRGCLDAALNLLHSNGIRSEIQDERLSGERISARFSGSLRKDQQEAVRQMLKHEVGVLCAPTAFGKTVTAAAIIARRKVSTLVLVHRTALLRQWTERLTTFLELPRASLGAIGGGKHKPTGRIDIAVMQSLSKRDDLAQLLYGYGQIIVDECHHISAVSFEAILKKGKSKYVVGLTATPIRRDGHHPIIFMQCGPVRHSAPLPDSAPKELEVHPRFLPTPEVPPDVGIQEVFRRLANDPDRTRRIAQDVLEAYSSGRKILVLTERTQHVESLHETLCRQIENCLVLHGRLSRKQRSAVHDRLAELEDSAPRVLIATGKLVGEGFDHAPLDTLVLAMPISWKGTLQQYAGRLHREHTDKQDLRIYDYVEPDQPQLARMWDKRQRGYRAMGYRIVDRQG